MHVQPIQERDISALQARPAPSAIRIIDFDTAEVVPGIVPNSFILIVHGHKPWLTMKVELQPQVYIAQPDYWGIEVVGTQSGIGLPVMAPYTVALDLAGSRGTIGIEVIGANKQEKIKVP